MTINVRNHRIKSIEYGWMVQKKVGNQWKHTEYFRSLDQAAANLLDQSFHEQTTDIDINTTNQSESARLLKELAATLSSIRFEILEAINGKSPHS